MTEIQGLRKQVRILTGLVVVMGVGVLGLAAAPQQDRIEAREIVLTNPQGGAPIHLSAGPQSSGMWIGDPAKGKAVAVYHDGQNAVVGTYDGRQQQAGGTRNVNPQSCDTALASTANGPVFQLAGKERSYLLSPTNWNPGAQKLNGQNEIQFTSYAR